MNKDTLTGMVLMAVVFIGYLWWMQPSQEEIGEDELKAAVTELDADSVAEIVNRIGS